MVLIRAGKSKKRGAGGKKTVTNLIRYIIFGKNRHYMKLIFIKLWINACLSFEKKYIAELSALFETKYIILF